MALKAVLLLALAGLVYSEPSHCSGAVGGSGLVGRDCTCADKAFGECDEPAAQDSVHVVTWQECHAQCELFASFQMCEWWLFNIDRETMADYLGSCNIIMGPLFDTDDNLLTDCDDKDTCYGYVESECAKKGIEVEFADNIPSLDICQTLMASRSNANVITYYMYDVRAKVCKGYGDGLRDCENQVSLQTLDVSVIESCQT